MGGGRGRRLLYRSATRARRADSSAKKRVANTEKQKTFEPNLFGKGSLSAKSGNALPSGYDFYPSSSSDVDLSGRLLYRVSLVRDV